MKINSILLIIFCLLQGLICSTVGLNEQSLKDATIKTLKYFNEFHQGTIRFPDKKPFSGLQFTYSPLTIDNIQIKFDEYKLLHIKYVNLKADLTGQYKYRKIFEFSTSFTAQITNFNWEQVFVVSQDNLANGKIDIKFKSHEESVLNFNIFRLTSKKVKYDNDIKKNLLIFDYAALKDQLRKISNLIFDTLQTDLNKY
jgi:hypothetical protein